MAQAALYRRYRSKSFADVVGQEHVTALLDEAVKRGAISHAYLFTGPKGVGKTSVARILAHAINELPYSEDTHLDIIEIDAASNRRIDDIRDLREKVHIAPVSAKYKVYIIDEVHMLTGDSFNALLKTLEEPPSHVVFILATTEIHKVPATIISRTQRFQFKPGISESVVKHLRSIATKEKIDIEDSALETIARHGDGSFRDSVSLLDQVSSSAKGKVTVADVENLLGLVSHEQIMALVDSIKGGKMNDAVALVRKLQQEGMASTVIASQLARSLATSATTANDFQAIELLLEISRSAYPDLKLVAIVARISSGGEEPKSVDKKPVTKAEAIQLTEPIITKEIKPAPVKSTQANEEATPSTHQSTTPVSGELDWDLIMTTLAKRDPPLFSVLKRAEMSYENEALVLEFAFALHQKKLEDNKYRTKLVSLITDLCGSCPELVIRRRTAKPPKHPVAAEVADIMGGGEEVNAK